MLNSAANAGEAVTNPEVNANTTEPIEQPTEPTTNEPTQNEPIQQPQEDITQTQAFSKRLKEATEKAAKEAYQKGRDEWFASQGYEWKGKAITTEAEYNRAIREKQLEDAGVDPSIVNQAIETHPDVQWARQMREQEQSNKAFEKEALELFDEFPELKVDQIQPEVYKMRQEKGLSLLDAYLRVNHKSFAKQAEQQAVQKIISYNSPGALSSGAEPQKVSIKDMPKTDFAALKERVLRGEKVRL